MIRYENKPGSSILPDRFGAYHGAWYSSVDQTLSANTAGAMRFENTQLSNGISVTNNSLGFPTKITFEHLGVYNIAFSAQLHNTGGGGPGTIVDIWLKHNDVTEPNTNTRTTVNTNSPFIVAAWNFFVEVDTLPQWFEIFWQTENANIILEHLGANGNMPATPSIIVTANQVG